MPHAFAAASCSKQIPHSALEDLGRAPQPLRAGMQVICAVLSAETFDSHVHLHLFAVPWAAAARKPDAFVTCCIESSFAWAFAGSALAFAFRSFCRSGPLGDQRAASRSLSSLRLSELLLSLFRNNINSAWLLLSIDNGCVLLARVAVVVPNHRPCPGPCPCLSPALSWRSSNMCTSITHPNRCKERRLLPKVFLLYNPMESFPPPIFPPNSGAGQNAWN